MLELNAKTFLKAITGMRQIATILETLPTSNSNELIKIEVRQNLLPTAREILAAVEQVGAKSAWVAADRFLAEMAGPNDVTGPHILRRVQDIESRFADHLDFIRLFVIHDDKIGLFSGAEMLLGEDCASKFPSLWFDCEESAKSLCLGRSTASVFHSMRMLECGIRALARRLDIVDPVTANDRNWGAILRAIKVKMDSLYPPKARLAGSEGSYLDGVYVSLDAIKNPWRNATMHVENVYTEEEARHILMCSALLIQKMAEGFDENGLLSSSPVLLAGE